MNGKRMKELFACSLQDPGHNEAGDRILTLQQDERKETEKRESMHGRRRKESGRDEEPRV